MSCRSILRKILISAALVAPALAGAGVDTTYDSSTIVGSRVKKTLGVQRSIAVLIGISDYTDTGSGGFKPLPSARGDVERMRKFLVEDARFDIVHVLTEEKATRSRIEEIMIDFLPSQAGPNDRILVYWSGHGVARRVPSGRIDGYLPLRTSRPGVFSTMVGMDNFQRWNDQLNAKHVLFIIDACVSGLAGKESKSDIRNLTIEQLDRQSSHLLAAGSSDEEVITGDRWQGSLFTDALIRGASGDAATVPGIVSLTDLLTYVRRKVAFEKDVARWKKTISPQLRDLGTSDGEFYFLVGNPQERTQDALAAKGPQSLERKGESPTGDEAASTQPASTLPRKIPAGPLASRPPQSVLKVSLAPWSEKAQSSFKFKGISPDGDFVAYERTLRNGGTFFDVYSVGTGKRREVFEVDAGVHSQMAFSPDGKRSAVAVLQVQKLGFEYAPTGKIQVFNSGSKKSVAEISFELTEADRKYLSYFVWPTLHFLDGSNALILESQDQLRQVRLDNKQDAQIMARMSIRNACATSDNLLFYGSIVGQEMNVLSVSRQDGSLSTHGVAFTEPGWYQLDHAVMCAPDISAPDLQDWRKTWINFRVAQGAAQEDRAPDGTLKGWTTDSRSRVILMDLKARLAIVEYPSKQIDAYGHAIPIIAMIGLDSGEVFWKRIFDYGDNLEGASHVNSSGVSGYLLVWWKLGKPSLELVILQMGPLTTRHL